MMMMMRTTTDSEPTNYEYFNMRAILYLAMGRTINAIRDYTTVLTLKPDSTKVRLLCVQRVLS